MQDRYEYDTVKMNLIIDLPQDIILQPDNNLYINLSGIETNQLESFNKQTTERPQFNELMLYFQGYMIDANGYIDLPVIGKIKVGGVSFSKAKVLIQNRYAEFLKGVIVDVRLVSYEVTILGDIKRPGKYIFYKPNINILDVLAKSGDLTDYGDAKNILVIRNKGENSESVRIDLTKTDVFQNPYFWLEPNDVVYVKPLRAKIFSVNSTSISLFFSSISLLLVLLTYTKF